MPKIFDLTLLTQKKEGTDTAGKVFNYFWKTFDFRNGNTQEKLVADHPYCANPLKSMSKST